MKNVFWVFFCYYASRRYLISFSLFFSFVGLCFIFRIHIGSCFITDNIQLASHSKKSYEYYYQMFVIFCFFIWHYTTNLNSQSLLFSHLYFFSIPCHCSLATINSRFRRLLFHFNFFFKFTLLKHRSANIDFFYPSISVMPITT